MIVSSSFGNIIFLNALSQNTVCYVAGDEGERRPMIQANVRNIVTESWANYYQFLFSSIGLTVGIGNIWRFSYLCQKHGGGNINI